MQYIEKICAYLLELIQSGLQAELDILFRMTTTMIDQLAFEFWSNPLIQSFLSFSQWVNGLVFAIAFLFALFDAAEEAGSMKQIDWTAMVTNFIKGGLFVGMYSYFAIGMMQLANSLTRYLNLGVSIPGINDITNGPLQVLGEFRDSFWIRFIASIGVLIALIGFIIISIKRFGTMLVQVLTSAFYVPDIMRGETTKVGDWLRQTVAIAFTYTFQYILFYCGFAILMDGTTIQALLIGVGMWLVVPTVPQILAKYGQSSGTKGGMGIGSLASQGLMLLTKR